MASKLKSAASGGVKRIGVLVSGVFAILDVSTDYAVLKSLNTSGDSGWFKISFGIIAFAAVSCAFQLFRYNWVSAKLPLLLAVTVLSLVQGHWLFLFFFIITNKRGWEQWAKWFEATAYTEVILESVPQLLLQTYIVLASIAPGQSISAFQAQLVSIAFSLLVAGKTLLFTILGNIREFQSDQQREDGSCNEMRFYTPIIAFIFSYASLASRSLLIVCLALGSGRHFWFIIPGMFGVRLLMRARAFRYARNLADIYVQIQGAITNVFRDYLNDPVGSTLSTVESILFTYLVFNGYYYAAGSTFWKISPTDELKSIFLTVQYTCTALRIVCGLLVHILRTRGLMMYSKAVPQSDIEVAANEEPEVQKTEPIDAKPPGKVKESELEAHE